MRHQLTIILTGILLLLGTATPLWGQVFISELGDPEDTWEDDRFIEIYNAGPCTVDLNSYSLKVYGNVNSAGIPSNTEVFNLSGTLSPGATYTLGTATSAHTHDNSSFDNNGGSPLQGTTYSNWNGDNRDGVSLYHNNTLIDSVVGIYGSPTTDLFDNSSMNRIVCSPNTVFDVAEWNIFQADSVTDCSPGIHNTSCTTSTATFAIPQDSICFSADSLVLWPFVSDSSGFFSGMGVQNDSVFYPNLAGSGSIEIQYNFTLPTCTIVLLDTIEVVQAIAQITPLAQDTVCQSNGPISLSGTPAGGTFYFDGTALPGSSLDLSGLSSTGSYDIVYEVTSNGCTDSDTVSVYIVLSNSYSVAGIPSQIGIYEPPITFNNLGTYVLSGTGTSDSVFFPHTAGIGTHTLTLTDSSGCSSPISLTIDVVDYLTANSLNAPSNTTVCLGDTATLVASNSGVNGTQNYSDSILPFFYRPLTGSSPISFSDEDHHSSIISLPFEFCFYGQTFDKLVVSSNGYITFDTAAAGTNSPMSAGDSIPTDALPNYCILGPWSDYNTNFGGVSYKIVGTAPHRKFILEYNDVVIWASPSYITTQIHLYESTNFIETHVLEREFYSNRELIHGLKKDSLDYHIIPGRNYQVTSILNESRRFYPDGAGDIVWFDDTGNLIASGDTLRVSPSDSTSYTALAGCALNDTVGLSSQVFVHVNPNDTAFITNPIDTICISDSPIALTSSLTGTTFEIDGSPATNIDPSALGSGPHQIVSFPPSSSTCGCNDTLDIFIRPLDMGIIALNADTLCTGETYTVTATPPGGTFLGLGVDPTSGAFDAAAAGVGSHTVYYTPAGTCVTTDSIEITVLDSTLITLQNLASNYCSSDPAVTLQSNPTTGVSFTIDGSPASSLDPTALGAGTYTVIASPSLPTDCSVSDTLTVTVTSNLITDITEDTVTLCFGQSYSLSVSPTGGVFSGAMSGPSVVFNSTSSGVGTHTVYYNFASSCSTSDSVVFIVNPADTAVLLQSTDTVCPNDSPFNLGQYTSNPSPSFTINGVAGTNFDPSAFSLGSSVEVILLGNGTICSLNDTMSIFIDAQTQPLIDQNDTTICSNSGLFSLSGNLSGAIFTGIGVVGNTFNPALFGLPSSPFNLPYTAQILYGDFGAQNCVLTDTLWVTVVAPPTATLSAIPDSVCSDEPAFTPVVTPPGGVLTMDGTVTSQIDPSNISPGTHIVTYSVTDANGCTGVASDTFTLFNASPASIALTKDTICADNTPFTLTANLTGGSWIVNGTGISGDQIIPNNFIGTNQVIYNYGQGTPCPSSDTVTLVVLPLPVVSITSLPDSICFNANAIPISATPPGGTFFGTGITSGFFDPVLSGTGTHTISYSFVNANGCADTATHTITVYQDTGLSFQTQPDTVCISSGNIALTASPTGGAFIGPGVTGTTFDPVSAGVGSHILKYVLPNGFCTDTLYDTLVVEEPLDPGQNAIIFRCVGNISTVNLFNNLLGSPDAGGIWTDPNGASVPNGIVSGTTALDGIYTYTVSNSCGTFTSQVTLNINPEPIVNGGGPVIISPGQSPVLPTNYIQGNNLQYNWSPGLSLIDSTVNNPTTVPLFSNTTFVFTVEDSVTGCQDTGFVDVLVTALPLSINPTANQTVLCAGNGTTLNANATGGSTLYQYNWSPGNFFSDSTIANPTITITTSQWVYLSVFDGSDTVTDSIFIQVENPIPVNLPPIPSICTNGGQQSINNGATPSGGVFSGPGIVNGFIGIFDPLAAGPGTHSIVYTFTSSTGCTYADTQQVVVHVPSSLTVGTAPFFCTTSAPDTLAFVFPLGGTYTGNGVTNNIFDPASVGIGVYPLTYTYVDSNGCQISTSVAVTVGNAPNVTLGSLGPICENQSPFSLSNGSPSGGTYSGPGIVNDSLFPNTLAPGTYTITYDYTNGQGCSGQAVSIFTVEALPVVQLTTPGSICLNAGPTPLTGGTPAGGVYSGTGVIGGQFIPSNAGLGTHNIIYTYTSASGCTNTDTATLTVIQPSAISFPSVPQYCISDPIDTLDFALPIGGTYSGPQVTNGQFNPATAGVGNHQVTYTFVDSNGCTAVSSANIVVHALPGVYMNSITPLCYDASPLALTQGTPSGGNYSGPGVLNDTLFPNLSGPGTHPITYVYTNANGCTDSTTINVTVLGPPNLSYPSLDTVCLNSGNFPITSASPSGGSYSGPGVTNGIFNPLSAGLGTHTIQYIYTNSNGCSDTITSDITVTNPPPVVWSNFDSLFCITEPAFSLNGLATPGGGNYSGNGVTGNTFNPALAGPGTHNISYTYLDANGCSATGVKGITVVALPSVSIASQPDVCFNDAPFTLSGGLPFGGTYFGPGITNGVFDPAAAGTGNITIGYTYSNSVGCRDTAYQSLFVDSIPTITQIPYADYCVDANPVQLTGANPGGGVYFGNHVFAGYFYPDDAGVGVHTVYYRFTNAAGCADTLGFDITVNPLPVVQLSTLDTVCSNDSAIALTQGSPAGGTYSGPGVVNNMFYPNIAGHGNHTISYTYVDTNGCSNIDKEPIHVVLSPPVPVITENGNYLVCNWGFYQYQWYLDGDPIPGANAISHLADQPGFYQVQITNAYGCSSISGNYFLDIVSTTDHFLDKTNIYPNPSTGIFTLDFAQSVKNGSLTVYDATGRIVMTKKIFNLDDINIDLTERASGTYTLEVVTDDQYLYKQLVLEK